MVRSKETRAILPREVSTDLSEASHLNIFDIMYSENLNPDHLILEEVKELHNCLDLANCVDFLMHCYSNALLSDQFISKPQEAHTMFYTFRLMYNCFLKMDMYLSPEINGVNTF